MYTLTHMYTSLLGIQIQTGLKDSVYIELQSNLKYSAMNTSTTQRTRLSGFHSQSKGTVLALDIDWDQVDC